MRRAWVFQDPKQKAKVGDKCPWSVGWYDPAGKRRSKSIGSKSSADKYCRKVEGEMAAGLYADRKRTKWADFRKQFADVVLATQAESTAAEYVNALDSFERVAKPVYMDTISTATIDTFTAKRRRENARLPNPRKESKPAAGAASKRPKTKPEPAAPRNVAPATVNKELRHIRAALRKATKWGLISVAPDFTMLRESQRDPYYIDDATFAKLYAACDKMTKPDGQGYTAADWWKALLCFAYLTGWRIGEILDLRRADLDLDAAVAKVDADSTKGRRDARVELHPVVIEHVRAILGFETHVFHWPHHARTLWADFKALKAAAGVSFAGAFHRFRFGFANANVDTIPADLLQRLMRHQSAQTTRHYINAAERMKRSGVGERIHVPAFLTAATG
jgi:integrase